MFAPGSVSWITTLGETALNNDDSALRGAQATSSYKSRKYWAGESQPKSSQLRLATHHPAAVRKHRGIGFDMARLVRLELLCLTVLQSADQHTPLGSLTTCNKKNLDPRIRLNRKGAVIEPHVVFEESDRT